MIVIATCALLLRIVIDRVIKINIAQNESTAQGTLKLIATALENYSNDNRGGYPEDFSLLTKPSPPYLDKGYITQSPFKGYNYSCLRLEASGYSCSASPARCKLSGNLVYSITTGGILASEECNKKE